MLVKFTRHAKRKLEILGKLGVTEEKVIETLKNPDETLYDTLRDRLIAVNYASNLAIPFEREDEDVTIVTTSYSSKTKRCSYEEERGVEDGYNRSIIEYDPEADILVIRLGNGKK